MRELPSSLRYSCDSEPGITSKILKKSRAFYLPDGVRVKDEEELARLNTLAIPPAYKNVWICLDGNGHLQSTAYDDAGRKQYRYHEDWRAFRDAKKFNALVDFGDNLPRLRRRISRDLRRKEMDHRFATAALLRLIDKGALRIGNANYSQQNGSFGATTLRVKHLTISSDSIKLDYTAKGKKRIRKTIKDKTLNRVLEQIQDLPGREVFQYVGQDGNIYSLGSAQVNDYMRERFTAKTFRTWHGSVAAFKVAETTQKTLTIKAMAEASSDRLHNTPAISRTSYIHPAILKLSDLPDQERNDLLEEVRLTTERVPRLRSPEARCLKFLSEAASTR